MFFLQASIDANHYRRNTRWLNKNNLHYEKVKGRFKWIWTWTEAEKLESNNLEKEDNKWEPEG
jgi:hypothetical protein